MKLTPCNKDISKTSTSQTLCIWVFAIYMISATMALVADRTLTNDLPRFTDMVSAIDKFSETAPLEMTNDLLFMVDDEIVSISDFSLENTTKINKRLNTTNMPLGASWTRTRVVDQGTIWAPWRSASIPVANNLRFTRPFVVLLSWYYSATWDAGFIFNFAKIKASFAGYDISLEVHDSGKGTYPIPPRSCGKLFMRQYVLWQDQQKQKCTRDSIRRDLINCGEWGEKIRGNLPVKNTQGFGWRVERAILVFGSCRGVFE